MSTFTASAPPRMPPPEAQLDGANDTLDMRIQRAEQRLIAREQRVHRQVDTLALRLRQVLQPKRLLMPLAGSALALASLWWLRRGGLGKPGPTALARQHAAHVAAAQGGASHVAAGGKGWVRLLGLAWPLLPSRWKQGVSPAAASTLLSVGLPLAERLLVQRSAPPLMTMQQVDLVRFGGRWFEVARLPSSAHPRCDGGQPVTRYAPRFDGRIAVMQRCPTRRGLRVVNSMARPLPGSGGARLQISHWHPLLRWLPMAWQDHWILHVDDQYSEALIGSPGRDTLWLLSRRRALPPQRVKALVQIAQDRGFAVDRLAFSDIF